MERKNPDQNKPQVMEINDWNKKNCSRKTKESRGQNMSDILVQIKIWPDLEEGVEKKCTRALRGKWKEVNWQCRGERNKRKTHQLCFSTSHSSRPSRQPAVLDCQEMTDHPAIIQEAS